MESIMDLDFDIDEEQPSATEVRVHEWRTEQLERLGIARTVAEAAAGFVDWHELARLVERGCSPALALEIVR